MKTLDLQFLQRMALAVAVAIMVACSWLAPMESTANQQIDDGLKRALISFATARALNAGISVAQGTDFDTKPGGVGVKFAVGQVLRPLNDVVEQFAHLMLIAAIAFGCEKILVSIGAHWLISVFLTGAAAGWAYFYLRKASSPAWLTRIVVVLLMIRFAMPIVIIGTDTLFHRFMADDYKASQQVMEVTTEQLSSANASTSSVGEDQSMWDKVKEWVSQHANLKTRLDSLKRLAEQATERIIKLMVIFVLQTLILPIFFLWVLWGIARGVFEVPRQAAGLLSPRQSHALPPAAPSAA